MNELTPAQKQKHIEQFLQQRRLIHMKNLNREIEQEKLAKANIEFEKLKRLPVREMAKVLIANSGRNYKRSKFQ